MDHPLYLAVLLGIVEGLTEFIPVSSTGHLILVGELLGMKGDLVGTFEVFIQLGAILAIVGLYRKRLLGMISAGNLPGGAMQGRSGLLRLGVASLPAFIFGFLFHDFIKSALFSSTTVAWALIVGGLVLLFVEQLAKKARTLELDQISVRQSFGIGIIQCAALWPGISRSGSTIVGGILLGLDRRAAAEFSFLIAVPVMFGAVIFDLISNLDALTGADIMFFAVGFITSFVTAWFSVKWFLRLLERYTLRGFGFYRIAVGILVFACS